MRPARTTSLLCALLVPLIASIARSAHAEEPAEASEELSAQCEKLTTEAKYKDALQACERAFELNRDPELLIDMARLYMVLMRPAAAHGALVRYLDSRPVDPERRKAAKDLLDYLETIIATLVVSTRAEGAQIRIDDEEQDLRALERGVKLTTGAHRVTLLANGTTFSRFVYLRARERAEIELPSHGTLAVSCTLPQLQTFIDDKEVDRAQASSGIPQAAGKHRVTFKAGTTLWSEQTVMVNPDERVTVVCTAQGNPAKSAMNPRGYWVTGLGLSLGVAALATGIYNGHQYDQWETANNSLRENMRDRNLTFEQSQQIAQDNNQLMQSIQTTRAVAVGLGIGSALVTAGGIALLLNDSRKSPPSGSSSWLRRVAAGLTVNGAPASGEIAWRGAW